jgi:2-aminomuconate deaminase
MKKVLEEVGGTLENLVDITVFLTDMANYAEFNNVYNRYFQAQSGPARTTVGVASLPGKDLLIEIKGTAYLG